MKFLTYLFVITTLSFSCSNPNTGPITWTDCGGNVTDHACNFSLMDQTGDDWTLYDHYGSIIVLDFSAMWCGYCQKAAIVAQSIQDKYKNNDVIWVTILLQNNYGQQPGLDDLTEWTTAFDMTTAPVLSGNTDIIDKTARNGFNVRTWPGIVIIDRDMKIVYELAGWNEMQIKFWLDQLSSNQER